MNVKLYRNTSDPRVVFKSLEETQSSEAQFKNTVSIIRPVLLMTVTPQLMASNYVYIENLGRYYYINDISVNNKNVATVECSVDVLYTYRTQIESLNVIASRSSNRFNMYLNDSEFITQSNQQVQIKLFSEKPFNPTSLNDITNCFVLQVARGGTV